MIARRIVLQHLASGIDIKGDHTGFHVHFTAVHACGNLPLQNILIIRIKLQSLQRAPVLMLRIVMRKNF